MNIMNYEPKNILIGKIGKTVDFKKANIRTGGDAPVIFYSTIARINPEYKFYIAGPNNIGKLTEEEYLKLFPNKNVYSVWMKMQNNSYKCIVDNLNTLGIHIDFALFFAGQTTNSCNTPYLLTNPANGEYYKTLECYANYAAPYITTLNYLQCPVYIICEDARYVEMRGKDVTFKTTKTFAQMNCTYINKTGKHIKSLEDHTYVKSDPVQLTYDGVEQIFLMGLAENWREQIDIARKLSHKASCTVFSNGFAVSGMGNAGKLPDGKYPEYKKYLFDNFAGTEYENTMVYGGWEERFREMNPHIKDVKLVDLKEEIADTRYTFVYSIFPGFVTAKPWEMISLGILPFMHPDYDTQHLLDLPDYLRVKDPQDFLSKMRYLDEHPNEYLKLLNECLDKITPDMTNGKKLNNHIFEEIAKTEGFEYEPRDGVTEHIFNRFDKNIVQ